MHTKVAKCIHIMANEIHDPNEWKTPRALLAFYWSICVSIFLGYILVEWGHILAILTLVIGLIGGTILGGIFGVYFAGALTKKPDTNILQTGDQPTGNVTAPATSGLPSFDNPPPPDKQ